MEESSIKVRSQRGFACMSKERQREIARRGGRAAHEKGTAHEFNSSEASLAARRGHEHGTAHEFTAEEAREAGRKGGLARARNRQNIPQEVAPQEQMVGAGSQDLVPVMSSAS